MYGKLQRKLTPFGSVVTTKVFPEAGCTMLLVTTHYILEGI